jgi:argininosuccinate lyase
MSGLSGRIDAAPSEVWHDEVLAPQFEYELRHLLPHYLAIEKVLLLEYRRLALLDGAQCAAIAARLHEITPESITADPLANTSDIAFAIERHVTGGPVEPPPAWHADRSRNDLQATAQLMFVREQVLSLVEALLVLDGTAARLAVDTAELPMPGYTHLQAAQIITPGFWLAALCAEVQRTLHRLVLSYQELDAAPLGAGAMAGQELPWDRQRMAALLGFGAPQPHALVAVASRGAALSVAADLSGLGVALSRFCTDLMTWGSSEYRFIDLPDALSGISSAMPQKKNFPILERIRGRTAHLCSLHLDMAIGQRNTPYTNMVEVSKEAGAHLFGLFETARSLLRLFTTVLDELRFDAEAMRAACEREYLGGFTLANLLTLRAGVPWRQAQVIAGRYVVAAIERDLPPAKPDGALLVSIAAEAGYQVGDGEALGAVLLAEAFSVPGALQAKRSAGSTNPRAVIELLDAQRREHDELAVWVQARRAVLRQAAEKLDGELELARKA